METRITIPIEDAVEIIAKFIEKEGYFLRKDFPVIFNEDQAPCFFAFVKYRSAKE
jgi:hypothetical protein